MSACALASAYLHLLCVAPPLKETSEGRTNCAKALTLGNVYIGLMDALLTVECGSGDAPSPHTVRRVVLLYNSLEVLRGIAKHALSSHGGQGVFSLPL